MTWTAPASWSSGATLTAAQLNQHLRDNMLSLKSRLDNVTNSTDAELGTNTTYLNIARAGIGNASFQGMVTGDANPRVRILADGSVYWGDGTNPLDTNLYRGAANELKTDDVFAVSRGIGQTSLRLSAPGDANNRFQIDAAGKVSWGNGTGATDLDIYRAAAAALQVNGAVRSTVGLVVDSTGAVAATQNTLTIDAGAVGAFDLGIHGSLILGGVATATGGAYVDPFLVASTLYLKGSTADCGLWFGPAGTSDTSISREATGVLACSGAFRTYGALINRTKAGIPSDVDLDAAARLSGAMILDTTNSRLYVRVGSTWKYASLV